jgi:hypothetical protein
MTLEGIELARSILEVYQKINQQISTLDDEDIRGISAALEVAQYDINRELDKRNLSFSSEGDVHSR